MGLEKSPNNKWSGLYSQPSPRLPPSTPPLPLWMIATEITIYSWKGGL